MSWFLFGKSGKSKQRGKSTARRKSSRKLPWAMMAKLFAVVAVVVVLGTGWYYGELFLTRQINRDHNQNPPAIVFHELPAWLGEHRQQELANEISGKLKADPIQHDSLSAAAHRLAENPWVESVQRLVRKPGGVVVVHATYRRPAALVAARDGYHLVDTNGHRLPGVYPFEQLRALGLIAVINVGSAPPAEGDRWPGKDLAGALKLIDLIAAEPFADQVRAVDVSNYAGRMDGDKPQLRIMTDRGIVRWGRAPGEEGVYEPDAPRKMRMLADVAQQAASRGRIDADGKIVDVFHDTPMIHQPDNWSDTRSALN